MKRLLLLMLLISFNGFSQDSKLLASCCKETKAKTFGRCSGDASCTACSNCRYCKHCNSGGTCGVCTTYSAPVKKKKVSYKAPVLYSMGDIVTVSNPTLNLRNGAGSDYQIIQKLKKGDELEVISYVGEWLKVQVTSSQKIGYVYYKYVN